jgi:hypothetical protein
MKIHHHKPWNRPCKERETMPFGIMARFIWDAWPFCTLMEKPKTCDDSGAY